MSNCPTVIGYKLEEALKLLGDGSKVNIDSTITPYEDKIEDRMGNSPIVVRQKTINDEIFLTVSYFGKSTLYNC